MRIKYLLIKCNLTLLTASGARDIQSTITMLVSLVYFLSTQSNVGKYLTYRIPPTLPPLQCEYSFSLHLQMVSKTWLELKFF